MKKMTLPQLTLVCFLVFASIMMLTGCTDGKPNDEAALEATKALIATYVSGTQTANAIPEATATPRPTRTEAPTWTPKPQATSEPVEPTSIVHLIIPVGPGLPSSQIVDTYSGNTGAEKRAPEGDYYTSQQLLERPFDQSMNYLAAIDIRSAELAKDENFIYITISMDQTVQAFDASYIVELDTDADGRGDFLIWADRPASNTWAMENVSILADTNNDIGGTDVLASDAPLGGNGFDGLIFSAVQFDDPDLAWARINPDRSGSIQIAFKPGFLDKGDAFFWRVWVDAGLQNPAAYYYQDFYTIAEAGSPLVDSQDYPLGTVYAVDNTCRMPFQITNNGFEPGLCGDGGGSIVSTATPKPETLLTKLPTLPKP